MWGSFFARGKSSTAVFDPRLSTDDWVELGFGLFGSEQWRLMNHSVGQWDGTADFGGAES
jgi:hypothetical protein